MENFRSDIAKAKGLGAAHSGVHHWIHQRFTSAAMILLTGWMIYIIIQLAGREISEVIEMIKKPYNVLAISLFIINLFYHASLGMQVVIEDYAHCRAMRLILLFTVKSVSIITTVAMIIAVLSIMIL